MDGHHDAGDASPNAAQATAKPALRRDIIAVGGSAGALDVMLAVAAAFDADFSGNIFVVSHIGLNRSHLPDLLSAAGPLRAKHPEDREPVRPGTIYVAPPDRHMLVEEGRIRLSRGPREHFSRPAIDPLFRSVALEYGPRLTGVVLSGSGSDGAAGLGAVKQAGGRAIVQRPDTALFSDMPQAAVQLAEADGTATPAELPDLLRRLSLETVSEASSARKKSANMEDFERPTALTCPECGGALREDGGGGLLYRCHTGHRFAADEVLTNQGEAVDHALGVAIRVLNERVELCRRMAESARAAGRPMGDKDWQRHKTEAEHELAVLRNFLTQR